MIAGNYAIASQQVAWWEVHVYVEPTLTRAESWPTVGTPAWCALDATNPAKIAAVFDAAQHWALHLETCQQAECEASHEVSAAADWSAIARGIVKRQRAIDGGVYIPRKEVSHV